MRVAIVGGTGNFGRALVERLKRVGDDPVIGSRDAERAAELGAVYGVDAGPNADVVRDCELIVLAVQSRAAVDTARELADAIGTTPVLCVASDLEFTRDGVAPGRLGRSLAEEVADVLIAPVASGLQSVAAAELVGPDAPDQDALICGDDPEAKRLALELAGRLCDRALDVGPLANARALEGMTSVILNVNRRYRAHAGIRLTGIG